MLGKHCKGREDQHQAAVQPCCPAHCTDKLMRTWRLLHPKRDFQQAQVLVLWNSSRPEESRDLPVAIKEVCGEETSPIFSSPQLASQSGDAEPFLCKPQRCSEVGGASSLPSKVRETPEEMNASPCFPTSPHGAEGAVGRGLPHCTPRTPQSPILSHGALQPQRIILG